MEDCRTGSIISFLPLVLCSLFLQVTHCSLHNLWRSLAIMRVLPAWLLVLFCLNYRKSCLKYSCLSSSSLADEIRFTVTSVNLFVCMISLPPLSGPFTLQSNIVITAYGPLSMPLTTCSDSIALGTCTTMNNLTSAWIVGSFISGRWGQVLISSWWGILSSVYQDCFVVKTPLSLIHWLTSRLLEASVHNTISHCSQQPSIHIKLVYQWLCSKNNWAIGIQKIISCHCLGSLLCLDTQWNNSKIQTSLPAPVTPKVSFICTRVLDVRNFLILFFLISLKCSCTALWYANKSILDIELCNRYSIFRHAKHRTQTVASQEVSRFFVWPALEFSVDCGAALLSCAINTRLAVCLHWDSLCFWCCLFVVLLCFHRADAVNT